jgi:multidrug transporter EmrE-like cation transporter
MTLNLRELPRRSSKLVDLNLLKIRISSNLPEFDAYAYFSREVPPTAADEPADYEIHCVDLDRDTFDTEELRARADRTLRAKRFRAGYYLNHVPGLFGGVLSVVSYGLVLWAQTRAPLAPVAVLRESSVIAGAAISVFLFKERFGAARIVAASVMMAGIALMLGTT